MFNAIPVGTRDNDYFCTDLQMGKLLTNLQEERRKEYEQKEIRRPIQGKFLKHAAQQPGTQLFGIKKFMSLPTCPRCDRAALHDRRSGDPPKVFAPDELGFTRPVCPVTCPHCGYHGMGGIPVKLAVQEV